VAKTASCGSGKEATGFSKHTEGAATNCAGVWWPRWQYGQRASSFAPWWFQSLTTPVAKTRSAISASDTPSIRIVFCTVCLAGLNQETDLLNTNWMWDVRKALPVTLTRKVTVGLCGTRFSLSGFA